MEKRGDVAPLDLGRGVPEDAGDGLGRVNDDAVGRGELDGVGAPLDQRPEPLPARPQPRLRQAAPGDVAGGADDHVDAPVVADDGPEDGREVTVDPFGARERSLVDDVLAGDADVLDLPPKPRGEVGRVAEVEEALPDDLVDRDAQQVKERPVGVLA